MKWSFWIVVLASLFSQGCGFMQTAGGSTGTDNPAIVAFSPTDGLEKGDSISIRVWGKDQNPLLDSVPLLDTLVVMQDQETQVKLDTSLFAKTSWNLEIQTSAPQINTNEDWLVGPTSVMGNALLPAENVVGSSSSQLQGDTLIFHQGVLESIPEIWSATPAHYLVVLGTSVIVEYPTVAPVAITFTLSPAVYQVVIMDAQKNLLSQWRMRVIP